MESLKSDSERLIEAISSNSSYNFDQYSEKSFHRRVEKILSDHKLSMDQIIEKLSRDSEFLEEIVKDITVNTTEIFRDTSTWLILKEKILYKFADKQVIDIWHIGCSTGQEVYSTLILLNELNLFAKSEIIATDLNEDVLKIAEEGIYKFREINEFIENYEKVMHCNLSEIKHESGVHYDKYFVVNPKKNLITIKPLLLNKAVYRKHDIVNQGNIFNKKFDIIFCRNVLIYFNHELQNRLFEFFYDNLNTDGVLVIGRHEGMLGDIAYKFIKEESVYIKKVT
ncbi:MAG: CheR family methyltransferase [Bacteroidales bacterium]